MDVNDVKVLVQHNWRQKQKKSTDKRCVKKTM